MLGESGNGMSTEVWWSPSFQFESWIAGQSAKQLADEWERYTGTQWTQPLGYGHALWEVGLASLKGAADPHDKNAVRDSIAKLKVDTVVGSVNFKGSAIKNVAITNMAGGQWRKTKQGSRFPNQLLITTNETARHLPLDSEFKLRSQLI